MLAKVKRCCGVCTLSSYTSDFFLGWQTHGYKQPGDLTSNQVKSLAEQGWLTNKQYLAILYNSEQYSDLLVDEPPFPQLPSKDECLGRIFLCHRHMKLPERWPVTKLLIEEIDGVGFMYRTAEFTDNLERRSYETVSRSDYRIYHYFYNEDVEQKDRASTKIAIDEMKAGVNAAVESEMSKK